MREIDELRAMTALRLLTIWRETRETAEDPLERTLLCNARVLAECCFFQGEPVYGGELEVLKDLTGRQMERLLRRLSEGGQTAPAARNPAFDDARFRELRGSDDMDYIREELLRQHQALAALLLGGAAEEHDEKREQTAGEPVPAEWTAPALLKTDGRGLGDRVSSRRETAADVPAEMEAVSERDGGDPAGLRGRPRFSAGRSGMAGTGPAPVWGGAVPLESGGLPTVLWMDGERPAPGARELSRAFQRDARRYDGGFAPY